MIRPEVSGPSTGNAGFWVVSCGCLIQGFGDSRMIEIPCEEHRPSES